MNDSHPTSSLTAAAHRCSACSRCFIALNVVVGRKRLCVCGGGLLPHALPHGLYELAAPEPYGGCLAVPEVDGARAEQGETQEADLGYGASHGYDDSHGGPSGPGDASASSGANEGSPRSEPR